METNESKKEATDYSQKEGVNAKDENATTSLIRAIEEHDTNAIKMLIDAGADVNAGEREVTPLTLAVRENDINAVKMLIDAGADLNKIGYDGNFKLMEDKATPLTCAAKANATEILKTLIDAGADLNARNGDEYHKNFKTTALMEAAKANAVESVKMLIDAGADVNAEDHRNCTALVYANSAEIGNMLLEAGAELHAGYALANAATLNSVYATKLLLDNGADVDASTWYSDTPLIAATENNSIDAAKVLIDAGADIDKTDEMTALMYAAKDNNVDIAQMLIDAGADVNMAIAYRDGRTALMVAATYNNVDIAQMLIDAGADVNIADYDRKTALMYAAEIDVDRCVLNKKLELYKANLRDYNYKELEASVIENFVYVAKMLIDAGAGVNAKDYEGNTALSLAKEKGNDKIVKMLLDAGATES